MAVSPPPAPSSIDLSGLPPRVVEAAARVLALCRELRSEPRPEAPEEVELRVREATNEFARDVMGAVIENRDDGASRIERDGQSWFRVAVTPKTIMTSLGPVTYRRARYRSGASGASPVPVDESLGLVDDYLTRPAAELGLLMMGRCTAREAAAFFAKTGAMTPSVSTLQRLTLSMHECWESLGPETLGSIREAEGIPQDATTASVSLDGVMVPLRPGEDGRAKASWREAARGTVSFHDAEGKRLKTLYLGRMPESGKLTLKAQLASEVAHIRRARPEIGIVAIADGAPPHPGGFLLEARTGVREAAAHMKDLAERFAELRNAIMRLPGNPSCDERAGLRHQLFHLEHTLMSARGSLDDVVIAIIDANDAVL